MSTNQSELPMRIEHINPEELEPSDQHVRSDHEDPSPEFVTSVRENGIAVPLQGRPEDGSVRLLDGVRRASAGVEAGLSTVPVLVEDLDDTEALARSLTLNDPVAGVEKEVVDADRQRSVRTAAEMNGESVEETRMRLGLWSEADRIANALDPVGGVGQAIAEELADELGDLESVRESSLYELAQADGVGDVTARAIQHHLQADSELVA